MTTPYHSVIAEQVEKPASKEWHELLNAMQNYLEVLRNRAHNRSEKAQLEIDNVSKQFKAYTESLKKQRRYGTNTGIFIKQD